jgi:hypothetical protein
LAATRSRAHLVSLNNYDVSGGAIKPPQVVVLWSLLTLARKTVCHPSRLPPVTTYLQNFDSPHL